VGAAACEFASYIARRLVMDAPQTREVHLWDGTPTDGSTPVRHEIGGCHHWCRWMTQCRALASSYGPQMESVLYFEEAVVYCQSSKDDSTSATLLPWC
jgi:hypothetical protein